MAREVVEWVARVNAAEEDEGLQAGEGAEKFVDRGGDAGC